MLEFFNENLNNYPIFQMDLRNIPEEVVKETLEYKCLQSQFSLLYNESLGVKTQLDEARALLLTAKNAHLRQIEHMEVISDIRLLFRSNTFKYRSNCKKGNIVNK